MKQRKDETITVQGMLVTVASINKDDYISLTDMAKIKNKEIPATVISHWLSTNFTINFMGVWEKMHNSDGFNLTGFREVKMLSTESGFALSPKQWIEKTNAKGITSRAGRYGGGTFAHRHIAFLESINALLIREGLPQEERLILLNRTAITQLTSLLKDERIKLLGVERQGNQSLIN